MSDLVKIFQEYHDFYKAKDDEDLASSPTDGDNLFDEGKVLRHFGSKIRMAQRIGLISLRLAEDLHRLKKIRKHFQDSVDCYELDHREVKDFCESLIAPKELKAKALALTELFPESPRGKFEFTITLISSMLDDIHKNTHRVSQHPRY